MNYDEFNKAVVSLGLISKVSRRDIRDKYLKLSKLYHPDCENGDIEKFHEISEAYRTLTNYIDSFRFSLDKNEFRTQHPLSGNDYKDWLC